MLYLLLLWAACLISTKLNADTKNVIAWGLAIAGLLIWALGADSFSFWDRVD
jgi:hypothetical protein